MTVYPPLTDKQIEEYINVGGSRCLYCYSKDIEGGNMDADGEYIYCVVDCNKCHSQWQDAYKLSSVTEMRDGPFSDMLETEVE